MINEVQINKMRRVDWGSVSKIYKDGIETGLATFEKEIPSWEKWDKNHLKTCRLIAILDNKILGWAALSAVSSRCIYRGVAEVSVYVAKQEWGNKIGEKLMLALIGESEKEGLWTLQSGIFSNNLPSIELHKNVGFRVIGYREKIGRLNGEWKDNILMERRSKIIGV